LIDRSTNGGFLQVDGDEEQRIDRDLVKLCHFDAISLGRDAARNGDALIYF